MEPTEVTIHGHVGILGIAAADGYVHLQVRDDVDGPVLGGVTLEPTAPLPLAVGLAFSKARQQRREQQERTDRAMKILLGDATDYDALLHRLESLVTIGRIDVDLEVGEAAEKLLAAGTTADSQPDMELTSTQCEDQKHQECDNDGCACACHTPDDPCCADPECGRR